MLKAPDTAPLVVLEVILILVRVLEPLLTLVSTSTRSWNGKLLNQQAMGGGRKWGVLL